MHNYLGLIDRILHSGEEVSDRTGVGTTSLVGEQLKFWLPIGFPAVTTKQLAFKAVVSELLWFIEGSTNERRLAQILHGTKDSSKKTIWTDNAENQGKALGYTDGELGPVYGKQWRDFNGVDQLASAVNLLTFDPYSRRNIVSAWNPGELDQMALPPCHLMFQFIVRSGYLNCVTYQRSCDVLLGLPFNIASYALLTHIIATEVGLLPGELVMNLGDAHIYNSHIDACHEQLEREVKELPQLLFIKRPWELYSMDDFMLVDYKPHGKLENNTGMVV